MMATIRSTAAGVARRAGAGAGGAGAGAARRAVAGDAGIQVRTMSKIVYTYTDEAPMLATYAFLPVIRRFADPVGVDVELSDISVAARIRAVTSARSLFSGRAHNLVKYDPEVDESLWQWRPAQGAWSHIEPPTRGRRDAFKLKSRSTAFVAEANTVGPTMLRLPPPQVTVTVTTSLTTPVVQAMPVGGVPPAS